MRFSNLPPTKEKLADTTEKREKRLQLLSFFACVILMHITGIILREPCYMRLKKNCLVFIAQINLNIISCMIILTAKTDAIT